MTRPIPHGSEGLSPALLRLLATPMLCMLVACAGRSSGGSSSGVASAAGAPTPAGEVAVDKTNLDAMLEDHCGLCHNLGDENLPEIGAGIDLSPRMAIRAAEVIAAGAMPPGGSEQLSLAEQRSLIASLCERATEQARRCIEALDPDPGPKARPYAEMLRAVRRAQSNASELASPVAALIRQLEGNSPPTLSLAYVYRVVIVAIDGCRSSQDQNACLIAALRPGNYLPPVFQPGDNQ